MFPDQEVGLLQLQSEAVHPVSRPSSDAQRGQVLHSRLDARDGLEAGGARLPPGGLGGVRTRQEVSGGGELVSRSQGPQHT